jgi:hypothetical protein
MIPAPLGKQVQGFKPFIGKDCFRAHQAAMVRGEDRMTLPKITGRDWRELPMVIILGLVIGLTFGQLVKLIPLEPVPVATRAKR